MFFRLGKSVLGGLAMLLMERRWMVYPGRILPGYSRRHQVGSPGGLALCFGLALLLRSWGDAPCLSCPCSRLSFAVLPLAPSKDRQWQADVAVLATAEIHGDASPSPISAIARLSLRNPSTRSTITTSRLTCPLCVAWTFSRFIGDRRISPTPCSASILAMASRFVFIHRCPQDGRRKLLGPWPDSFAGTNLCMWSG